MASSTGCWRLLITDFLSTPSTAQVTTEAVSHSSHSYILYTTKVYAVESNRIAIDSI